MNCCNLMNKGVLDRNIKCFVTIQKVAFCEVFCVNIQSS